MKDERKKDMIVDVAISLSFGQSAIFYVATDDEKKVRTGGQFYRHLKSVFFISMLIFYVDS